MAAPIRVAIAHNRTGRRAPILSAEEALTYRFTPEEQAIADEFLMGAIIGGPRRVGEALSEVAQRTGANELMLSGLIADRHDRVRSYERVAGVAGLA